VGIRTRMYTWELLVTDKEPVLLNFTLPGDEYFLTVNHVLSCRNMDRNATANRPRQNWTPCQAKHVFITLLAFAGKTLDVNGPQNMQPPSRHVLRSAYSCLTQIFISASFNISADISTILSHRKLAVSTRIFLFFFRYISQRLCQQSTYTVVARVTMNHSFDYSA
jgi:hypothetical protein